jgi:hypothetical protein
MPSFRILHFEIKRFCIVTDTCMCFNDGHKGGWESEGEGVLGNKIAVVN